MIVEAICCTLVDFFVPFFLYENSIKKKTNAHKGQNGSGIIDCMAGNKRADRFLLVGCTHVGDRKEDERKKKGGRLYVQESRIGKVREE
jgi:hypothetical protein